VNNLDFVPTAALQNFDSLRRELLAEVRRVAKASLSGQISIYPVPTSLDSIDRRIALRSIHSYLEANSFSLEDIANGTLQSAQKGRKVKLEVRVQQAFKTLANKKGFTFNLDTSSIGFRQLKSLTEVRDRITHPKSIADLNISDDEITDAIHAFLWFDGQCSHAFREYGRHLQETKAGREKS
jgi:hypothetical protein